MGKFASIHQTTHKDRKEHEKDREAKKKRNRQEALHRKIAVDPLPQDVCGHELATTWVSPVMQRQANEDDPLSVLRKTRAESRQCKMQVQPFMSMPLLRPSSKEEGASGGISARAEKRAATAPRAPSRGAQIGDESGAGQSLGPSRASSRGGVPKSLKAASYGGPMTGMLDQDLGPMNASFASPGVGKAGFNSAKEANALGQMRAAVLRDPTATYGSWAPGTETRAVGGSKEIVLPAQTLPRVTSAGGNPIPGAKPISQLVLEPPSSLSHRVVVNRLETQGHFFRQSTFAEYLKENDVFTGEPKVRLDEKRLKKGEDFALKKASSLVGGLPKRHLRLQLLSFSEARRVKT
jgi:hypothetical protein